MKKSTVDIIKKSKYYDILKKELDSQTLRSLIAIATKHDKTMKVLRITNDLNLESFIEGIIEYLENKKVFLKTNEMFDIGRLDVGMAESLKRALEKIRETKAGEKEIEEAAKAEAEAARAARAARKVVAKREQAAAKAEQAAAKAEQAANRKRKQEEQEKIEAEKREKAIADELRNVAGIEQLDNLTIFDIITYFRETAGTESQPLVKECRQRLVDHYEYDENDVHLILTAGDYADKSALRKILELKGLDFNKFFEIYKQDEKKALEMLTEKMSKVGVRKDE